MTTARDRLTLGLAIAAVVIASAALVLAAIALTGAPATPPPPPAPSPPAAAQQLDPSAEPFAETEPLQIPDGTRIEYELTTDGMSVTSLSYVVWKDDAPTMVNDDGAPAPFRQVVDVPKGTDLTDFSVTGVGGSTSRDATCTIRVNGEVTDTQTASGAYPIVTCVAAEP